MLRLFDFDFKSQSLTAFSVPFFDLILSCTFVQSMLLIFGRLSAYLCQ